MSRHIIPRKKGGYCVVGYDRPLDHYFCQVWSNGDDAPVAEAIRGSGYNILEFAHDCRAIVPDGLETQLFNEEAGLSDTNTMKDWRP